MGTYGITQINITNCLFYRPQLYFANSDVNPQMAIENCTMVDGFMVIGRNNWNPASNLVVENNAYDGTGFAWSDMFNSETNYTIENYNSYNTNNGSWQTFSYPYSQVYGTMQTVGQQDVMVTNYNWEASWFGNYYLPSDSKLLQARDSPANLLGLFYFTTQTNQALEGDAIVDIGYHYVATDTNGIPWMTYGDGVPDYLDDPIGDGLPNWWEIKYFGKTGNSPGGDPDGDGLTTWQEWEMHSQNYNPNNWHTFTNSPVGDGYQNYSGDGLANLLQPYFGGSLLENNTAWKANAAGDGLSDEYKIMVGLSTNSPVAAPGLPPYDPNPMQ